MQKRQIKALILSLVALIYSNLNYAQEVTKVTSDLETWSSIGIKFKPTKKLSLGLNQELRLENNSTLMDKTFSEFSLKYKFNKNIYVGFGTRFILNYKNSAVDDKDIRLNFDFGFNHKFMQFQLNYRLRYQNKQEVFDATAADPTKNYLR